jgi:hypothetical protein
MTSTPSSRPTAAAAIRAFEPAGGHEGMHDAARRVIDRDGEAEPDAGDGRVDPDDPRASVRERPSRVPGVQRRVGLDHVLDDATGAHRERTPERADDPGGDRAGEPHRVADRDDQLSDPEPRGFAELRRGEAASLEAEDRQVGELVPSDDIERDLSSIDERG